MDKELTRQKIKDLRAMVAETDRIGIVLQDDPDPDAMASAMALRALLGRNKQTTPIYAFAPVTRPENRTMVHLLEIEIQPATPEALAECDKIAMLDVQPPYFGDKIKGADIVIDHHPGYAPHSSQFQDLRPRYGATSTIMTEYMISADEHISERIGTALLYGIRTDTVMLSRRVTDDDVLAFTHLYPIANYGLLRQFERPELPLQFAKILSRAMRRLEVRDGIIVLNLGRVARDDLIVQMADFCLQFEGVEWVVVSGKLEGNLVIAVRNHGTGRRNAGEVVRKLFGEIGSAGGHRNMSKAVIALKDWRAREHTLRDSDIESRLRELFDAQISGDKDDDHD
ncbi:MAG TPA: DHH family phosphoesterase [Candidatus Binataceae bacterium]|nr:DHH family phosphoesterase [Candidatus Binataceae bacterium]